jgi:hypothetical protein
VISVNRKAAYPLLATRRRLTITAAASECCTQLAVLMCQVQDWLWQVGSLHDASHLNRAFVFNQLADGVEQVG